MFLSLFILRMLTRHKAFLALLARNVEISPELDLVGSTLGKLVRLRIRRDSRAALLCILTRREGTSESDGISDLEVRDSGKLTGTGCKGR